MAKVLIIENERFAYNWKNHFRSGTSVNSPVFKRGLWCAAYWSEITQSYTQVGQIFFYNNDTFSLNFLNDPLFTWVSE